MSDWPPRFQMAEMTPDEAGKFLRQTAETTAMNSQNWDNFEAIAAGFIGDAYKAGRMAATENVDTE